MTATDRPFSSYAAPAVIGVSAVLLVGNWYLRPDRAASWAVAAGTLVVMTLAFVFSRRLSARDALRHAGTEVATAVIFGGLIVVAALGAKLAAALGLLHSGDLSKRMTMVLTGAFLASAGNLLPKTLPPLVEGRCDVAVAQSLRRFIGWTLTLTGLGFALAWLVLPLGLAAPVSLVVGALGVLTTAGQIVRVGRPRTHRA